MRKAQKKQLEEMIALMAEAQAEIKNAICKKNISLALELLEQCQQAAIKVGTLIDQLEGEGHPTVTLLEQYCELVYKLHEELATGTLKAGSDAALYAETVLTSLWTQINKSVKEAIPARLEVVFCPYKVSMWDSLESVWKAAHEDENCDAYVIPIPYFDKKPDGSFGEMHYEGLEYPEYVPITYYKSYNFEERKPDVVFIHNPYDEYNRVTSVHPAFYATELKKHTEQLIYIPYFILGENIYESFCISNGTIFSDKTIVQSEKARKEFVYNLIKHVKRNTSFAGLSEEIINKKFVALGSPKIDKVVNLKKENNKLPQRWEDLLRNRKVVLYNTGVSGLLNGNQRELEKIQNVIEYFRTRNDVVLWWRPHPLSAQTISSMRSELLEKYKILVKEYQEAGFGIFDDTSDLHRAIAYSDMYYGDDSSITNLFGIQGKPIIYQNIYSLLDSEGKSLDETLCFDDCVCEEDVIWFFAKQFNGLFKMELNTGKIEWLGEVPGEATSISYLYSRIYKYGDVLWLVPASAKELATYHITEKKFVKYDIPGRKNGVPQQYKYAKKMDNRLYLVSEDYQKFAIVDMDLAQISVGNINLPKVQGKTYAACKQNIAPEMCLVEEALFWAIKNTNCVAKYNIVSGEAEVLAIGDERSRYNDIVYDGRYFWLASYQETRIVRWNPKDNSIGIIEKYPEGFENTYGFGKILFRNHFLWLFPARGNRIFRIDTELLQVNEVLPQKEKYDVWFAKECQDGNILTSCRQSGNKHTLLVLNPMGDVLLEQEVQLPQEISLNEADVFVRQRNYQYDYMDEYRLYESNEWNLHRVLNQLLKEEEPLEQQKKCYQNAYSHSDGTSGKAIWDMVLEECKEV